MDASSPTNMPTCCARQAATADRIPVRALPNGSRRSRVPVSCRGRCAISAPAAKTSPLLPPTPRRSRPARSIRGRSTLTPRSPCTSRRTDTSARDLELPLMPSVVVVGAGCFGAWTAYRLVQAGCDVTLLDAFGPGNARASSGGETRIIRMGYGAEEIYTRWAQHSLQVWKDLSSRSAAPLFQPTGVLWLARADDGLSAATLATLAGCGVVHERLAKQDLEARWPQIDCGSIAWAIHEPHSGVLMARRAVADVVAEAVRGGVRYVTAAAEPPEATAHHRLARITTTAGDRIPADAFVFACGPWLPKLFPEWLRDRIVPTRQEVLYFGPPAGDARFAAPALPAWIDFGAEMYGVPDVEGRGFKISLDRHGAPFDPDTGERLAGETIEAVRGYLARTFPAQRRAPLVASEVCQYENTGNGDFLIDRHPEMDNVWFVGGGSGHGFKHGPAIGDYVARLIVDGGTPDARFSLATKHNIQARVVY